jgi:M6 family metalloprotease-like protein
MLKKTFISVLLLTGMVTHGFTVPPLHQDIINSKPKDFKPCHIMSVQNVDKLKMMGAVRKAGERGIMNPETKKIVVIRVEFSNGPYITTSKADTEIFFDKMKNYFNENSYGLLTLSITVSDRVYRLSTVSNYNDETYTALDRLIKDTINASNADIDFSAYQQVILYHAGYGEEETGNKNDLWSLFIDINYTADNQHFVGFTVVPSLAEGSNSPLAVVCHEYGHQLGLPDLYDTSVFGGRSTCGAWSLMDYPYGVDNSGDNPPHLDPWCKNYLRFIDLSAVTVNGPVADARIDLSSKNQSGNTGQVSLAQSRANSLARAKTASSIGSVSFPVKVFC